MFKMYPLTSKVEIAGAVQKTDNEVWVDAVIWGLLIVLGTSPNAR
jgi:hypothetical protein